MTMDFVEYRQTRIILFKVPHFDSSRVTIARMEAQVDDAECAIVAGIPIHHEIFLEGVFPEWYSGDGGLWRAQVDTLQKFSTHLVTHISHEVQTIRV